MAMLFESYGEHFEDEDGNFYPMANRCHPALADIASVVRRAGEGYSKEFRIPILMADLLAAEAETETLINYSTLTFTRHRLYAQDRWGTSWTWNVWIDQYGRGVGGPRNYV